MSMADTNALLMGVGASVLALPLFSVIETMRPLPIENVPGLPAYFSGVSIIRGQAAPVIDLARWLEIESVARRFVLLRAGARRFALAVERVFGLQRLESERLQELPSLVQDPTSALVQSIGVRDRQLLMVLEAARFVPDDVWRTLDARTSPP